MGIFTKLFNKLTPGAKTFGTRLILFCVLFIVVTGILGPWIIRTKLLYGFHFFIYGNMGKMVLFSAIAFVILTWHSFSTIKQIDYKRYNLIFIAFTIVLIPIFFHVAKLLLLEKSFESNLALSLFAHLLAVLVPVTLAIGVFGIEFMKYFSKRYKKELAICVGLSIVFYFAIFQVWKAWPFFSSIVMKSVQFLLSFHVSPVREVGPLTLLVKNFAVRIEQACSGVDSIFLFSSLYILIGLVDWKSFNKTKLILAFFPALVGLFLVNILRVYVLILVGVYIDPQLTLQLFHTYLGMVLFIMYFIGFLTLVYKRLKK